MKRNDKMSGLDEGVRLLEWDRRMFRFKDEEKNVTGYIIIAFLLGVLLGMFLIRYLIPMAVDALVIL